MRLAIADPPYPPQVSERHDTASGVPRLVTRSRARRYYGDGSQDQLRFKADHHDDAGEWDDPARHRALLEQLLETYDGWAIATSMDGLDAYRPLPVGARTLIWRKLTSTRGGGRIANTMEAVIAYPHHTRRGRGEGPLAQVSDFLQCEPPAKSRFAGAKPPPVDALGAGRTRVRPGHRHGRRPVPRVGLRHDRDHARGPAVTARARAWGVV